MIKAQVSLLTAYRIALIAIPLIVYAVVGLWKGPPFVKPGWGGDANITFEMLSWAAPWHVLYYALWWRISRNGLNNAARWMIWLGPIVITFFTVLGVVGFTFGDRILLRDRPALRALEGFFSFTALGLILGAVMGLPIGYAILAIIFLIVWISKKLGLIKLELSSVDYSPRAIAARSFSYAKRLGWVLIAVIVFQIVSDMLVYIFRH